MDSGMFWESLRKGTSIVLVESQHTTDKVFAESIRLREDAEARALDVSLDLNKSLRTRSRGVSTYLDARRLADGDIAEIKGITIDDHHVLNGIRAKLTHMDADPETWRMHVALEGDHWFRVEPKYRRQHAYEALTLQVLSVLDNPPRL